MRVWPGDFTSSGARGWQIPRIVLDQRVAAGQVDGHIQVQLLVIRNILLVLGQNWTS